MSITSILVAITGVISLFLGFMNRSLRKDNKELEANNETLSRNELATRQALLKQKRLSNLLREANQKHAKKKSAELKTTDALNSKLEALQEGDSNEVSL